MPDSGPVEEIDAIVEPPLPPALNPGLVRVSQTALMDIPGTVDNYLTLEEKEALERYIGRGKPQLATETAMSFFGLFLNGYGVDEIHRMNPAFPVEAIHWARLRFDWDGKREKYLGQLHEKIISKVTKAQLETTNLMTDMLTVTTKKYGDKLKRYLQTGNEKDLGGAIEVDSIGQLLKLVDGLQKITGQSNTKNHRHDHRVIEEKKVDITVGGESVSELNEEEASTILSMLATAKRRKEREKKD